jgi:hypothetical protein
MAFSFLSRRDLGLVFLIFFNLFLSLLLQRAAFAQDIGRPAASFFVGNWKCEVSGQDVNFRWEVEAILEGRWLSGKTSVRGVLQSVDYWKVENNGQPSFRRVLLSDGSFVESSSRQGWQKLKLKSRGVVKEKKRAVETRETILWLDEKTFEAKLERKINQKWITQPKEICTRL